eukprot:7522276-Lingulodinium_polyedra.AAC.1
MSWSRNANQITCACKWGRARRTTSAGKRPGLPNADERSAGCDGVASKSPLKPEGDGCQAN